MTVYYILVDDDAMGNATQHRRLRRKCDCRIMTRVFPQNTTCPSTQPPTVAMTPSPPSTVVRSSMPDNLFPMGK